MTKLAWIEIAVVAVLAGACGSRGPDHELVVFAASSLTDAFAELERGFEAQNPGLDVVVSTGGSQTLRLQIEHSAAADVFASADARHVESLAAMGLVEDDTVFAANSLVVVVPEANSAGLETFADLPRARRIVLGSEEGPVGAYTRALLDGADDLYEDGFRDRVMERVVSFEPNVRLVVAKVVLGEADAAVVYRTDAIGRAVQVIPAPPELDVHAEYHMAIVTASPRARFARRWIEHVQSGDVLTRHGFSEPR